MSYVQLHWPSVASPGGINTHYNGITATGVQGMFQNTYELVNLRALKSSLLNKLHIFLCMGKIFCMEFQMVHLKFHTKSIIHTLKESIFSMLNIQELQIYGLLCVFETPPPRTDTDCWIAHVMFEAPWWFPCWNQAWNQATCHDIYQSSLIIDDDLFTFFQMSVKSNSFEKNIKMCISYINCFNTLINFFIAFIILSANGDGFWKLRLCCGCPKGFQLNHTAKVKQVPDNLRPSGCLSLALIASRSL